MIIINTVPQIYYQENLLLHLLRAGQEHIDRENFIVLLSKFRLIYHIIIRSDKRRNTYYR